MKRKRCMLIALVLGILCFCTGCYDEWNLEGKDTYEGLPVYQYNAEDNTVSIDGVLYKNADIDPDEDPDTFPRLSIGERFGYLWYNPHYDIKEGVIYGLDWLKETEDPTEYIYANSFWYKREDGTPMRYGILLKRVDAE